jgi:hypothetical protein
MKQPLELAQDLRRKLTPLRGVVVTEDLTGKCSAPAPGIKRSLRHLSEFWFNLDCLRK